MNGDVHWSPALLSQLVRVSHSRPLDLLVFVSHAASVLRLVGLVVIAVTQLTEFITESTAVDRFVFSETLQSAIEL